MIAAVYLPIWVLPAAFLVATQGWLLVSEARDRRRRRRYRERLRRRRA